MPRPVRRPPAPLDVNDLQKGSYPGDTVTVQDPPTSNGAATDAFDEEKGIKAPPGARGEFVEGRPPGNIGVPINPISPSVSDTNRRRRDTIPPMFLPAASATKTAQEEIEYEPDPKDDEDSRRITDYWEDVLRNRPQGGAVPGAGPEPVPGGQPNVPPDDAGAQPAATPIPLDRLNNPQTAIEPIYSITGTVNPGVDTTQQLKFYNLDPLIQNPQITDQMLNDLGYRVEVFSYDPARFRLPKLKTQGYGQDAVWIYDPEVEHGSFKDKEYTRAWRVFHEVGHGVTEDFMQAKYGPSRREGRLGVPSTSTRGVPGKQVQVEVRPLTLAEAQRAVEWEDTAFRAQQMLLNMYGVPISPEDFAKEYNVNIADALFRTMTGDFGDPGAYGYTPASQPADLKSILALLQAEEEEISREQGRTPTPGVNLAAWRPISDDEIRKALESRIRSKRHAFTVYPTPSQQRPMDERLLLQIPHDVQERYSDLQRRVSDYVRQIKLNTLDMFSFPSDPPDAWVEEERKNVQVDWDDNDAWASYMGKLSHDDVADWVGLEALDEAKLYTLAPRLHEQHALEAGADQDFNSWFRSRRPTIESGLVNHVRETARAFPSDGLGRGYSGYWRRRNHEMVRDIATSRAREKHDRYLREVAYQDHVKPNFKQSFDDIVRARQQHMPLSDVVNSLHSLPVEGTDRETVDGFRGELDNLVNEGVHALDLYRPPVSRDDRMFGDMEYQGEQWVPVRRIEGASNIILKYEPQAGAEYGFITAYSTIDGEPAGRLTWTVVGEDVVQLDNVEVDPKYRRQGIAAALVQQLRKEFPDRQIKIGEMTDEGAALLRAADPSIPLGYTPGETYPWAVKGIAQPNIEAKELRDGTFLVRWQGVGYMYADPTKGPEGYPLVTMVYLDEKNRGRGLSQALYDEMIKYVKQIGYKGLSSDPQERTPMGTATWEKLRKRKIIPRPGRPEYDVSSAQVPIALYRYGDRYFPVHESDARHIDPDVLMIRAQVFAVQPGSSLAKEANVFWQKKSRALAAAIREITAGGDKEATFTKYGRDYGPGLRRAINDYLFITQRQKQSDGGGGGSGSTIGDSTCSSFSQQSPDNCDGCTFNVGTGGPEFGYGDGACLLSELFINAPAKGFGRGDQSAYSPDHTPASPTVQDRSRDRRRDPRRP